MSNARERKLQYLLITQLLEKGTVELLLPDGVTLEIGITQKDEFGNLKKADDYCYVVASREGKTAMLDSYNLGIQYEPEVDTIIYEDDLMDDNGREFRTLEVI